MTTMTANKAETSLPAGWVDLAFTIAREYGYRPKANGIVVVDTIAEFNALVRPAHRREPSVRWLALCGCSHQGAERVVWVDRTDAVDDDFLAFAHELAHAVLPWRENHSEPWLRIHMEILYQAGRSDLAGRAAHEGFHHYGIVL